MISFQLLFEPIQSKFCILWTHALFCVAIDWILEHMSVRPGINIGNSNITDLVYVDDTALLLPSMGDAASCLSSFSADAAPLGLKISSEKTKLQNLGSSPQPTNISFGSNQVDSVDSFVWVVCSHPLASAAPTSNAASDLPHRLCRHCPGSGKTNI